MGKRVGKPVRGNRKKIKDARAGGDVETEWVKILKEAFRGRQKKASYALRWGQAARNRAAAHRRKGEKKKNNGEETSSCAPANKKKKRANRSHHGKLE